MKDRGKAPGISIDNIFLQSLKFQRTPEMAEYPELKVEFNQENAFSEDGKEMTIELACSIKDEGETLHVYCNMVGIFSVIEGKENMPLEEYGRAHAPATMFPFIREEIANVTLKAGIPPILLNPMNIFAATKNIAKEIESK